MSLIFLTNHLMSQSKLKDLRIPATFVCFGYVEGMLFKHYQHNQSSFLLLESGFNWGNSVVYGALYHINDYNYYIRQLDGYMRCSLSSISSNHKLDLHHRCSTEMTPIQFDTLDELDMLLYTETDEKFNVDVYVANLQHPDIKSKFGKRSYRYTNRLTNGIDAKSFIDLFDERNRRNVNE